MERSVRGWPTLEAFVAAIIAPAALFAVGTEWVMIVPALYVTAAHALVLGLPLFLFFRSKSWLNLPVVVASGMAIGFVPVAIVTCPLWVSDSPTAFEWRSYVSSSCLFSAFGGIAALTFWAYRELRRRMTFNSAP